jgi:hypothetical protein
MEQEEGVKHVEECDGSEGHAERIEECACACHAAD